MSNTKLHVLGMLRICTTRTCTDAQSPFMRGKQPPSHMLGAGKVQRRKPTDQWKCGEPFRYNIHALGTAEQETRQDCDDGRVTGLSCQFENAPAMLMQTVTTRKQAHTPETKRCHKHPGVLMRAQQQATCLSNLGQHLRHGRVINLFHL